MKKDTSRSISEKNERINPKHAKFIIRAPLGLRFLHFSSTASAQRVVRCMIQFINIYLRWFMAMSMDMHNKGDL
jgi:hypothetical protein